MVNSREILFEGPVWCNQSSSWFFVDILSGTLHKRSDTNTSVLFFADEPVSNVVQTPSGLLLSGQKNFFLYSHCGSAVAKPLLSLGEGLRCNDGSVGPDGKFYFGTMEIRPSGLNGHLYALDERGNVIAQGGGIGIPNTFVWLDERHVLISDSLIQKTFKVELLSCGLLDWSNRELWLDLQGSNATADGGALDEDGNVWLAIWGGACIHKYSPDAQLLEKFELQALQPTSCAFGGDHMDELLITSATEGMTEEQMEKYPDSGNIILRSMDVKGRALPVFQFEAPNVS